MQITPMNPALEPSALERLLRPMASRMSAELAASLAALQVDDATQRRYDELAEKRSQGTLSVAESAELEDFVKANSVLTLLKTEARLLLESPGA